MTCLKGASDRPSAVPWPDAACSDRMRILPIFSTKQLGKRTGNHSDQIHNKTAHHPSST